MSNSAEAIALEPSGDIISEPAPPTSKIKQYDRSIVEGPLTSAVWKIAWPAILTNLVSGIQGWVDQIMVGNLIELRFVESFAWPLGAAMSVALMGFALAFLAIVLRLIGKERLGAS